MDINSFSNLVSSVAVFGGVVFAGWQLRITSRQRTTEASLQMMQSLRSQEFVDGIMALYDLPDGLSAVETRRQLGEKWERAMLAMMNVDALGLLVYRGEIDVKLADDFFKSTVQIVWRKLGATIAQIRENLGDERTAEWLQWLAEEQDRMHASAPKPVYLKA